MAWPSSLARTKNWSTEILTDSDLEGQFDLIINYINDMMSSTTGHKHDATTAEGPKILVSDLSLTSGAAGDILYHNGTNLVRLAKGTALHHLRMNAGATAPEWAAEVTAATQAEQETGSSTSVYVTPGRQQFHPSAAKAWASFNGSGTPAIITSYNMDSSITDNGAGDWTLNITTDFSSANFIAVASTNYDSNDMANAQATAAGTVRVKVVNTSGNGEDNTINSVVCFGDQA